MNTSMFFINGSVAGKVSLKNLSDGTPVARFSACVEVEEGRTESLPIAVWGELAEKAAYLLYDGARVSVIGSIIERGGAAVLAGRKIDFIDTDAGAKKPKAQKPAKDDEDDGYEDDDSDDLDFFKRNNESEDSEDESEDSEDDDSDSEENEYDDDDDDDAFPF